jgi:hypothetical protein
VVKDKTRVANGAWRWADLGLRRGALEEAVDDILMAVKKTHSKSQSELALAIYSSPSSEMQARSDVVTSSKDVSVDMVL